MPEPVDQNDESKSTYEKLIATITAAIDDLLHLEVTTIAGKVDSSKLSETAKQLVGITSKAKVIHSRIGLLDGDIITYIDEAFIPEGDLTNLRTFHEERVKEGSEIIKRNIEALKELLGMVKGFSEEE